MRTYTDIFIDRDEEFGVDADEPTGDYCVIRIGTSLKLYLNREQATKIEDAIREERNYHLLYGRQK